MDATIDDLRAAYRIFFNRDPDAAGLADHSRRIANGISLIQLRELFLTSREYSEGQHHRIQHIEISPGLLVSVDAMDPEFGSAIARNKSWEPHLIRVIESNLSRGDVFVDVGANIALSVATPSIASARGFHRGHQQHFHGGGHHRHHGGIIRKLLR